MQTNRVCKTCGKKYFYCSNCHVKNPQWMLMWHEENCKNVFEIVSAFVQGQISKNTAKQRLQKCDLTHLYTFKENIRNYVEDILEEERIVRKINNDNDTKSSLSKVKTTSKRTLNKKRN